MNSLISKTFSAVKKENRPALLTYTVAGDNTKKKSLEILKSISNYAEESTPTNVNLKPFKIKDVINVDWGNTSLTKSSYKDDGKYLGVSAAGIDGKIDKYEYDGNKIVISAIAFKFS